MAGTRIIAPSRQELIDTMTRYPKKRIDANPENISTEKPDITVNPLITMLRPIILIADLTDSSYDRPFTI